MIVINIKLYCDECKARFQRGIDLQQIVKRENIAFLRGLVSQKQWTRFRAKNTDSKGDFDRSCRAKLITQKASKQGAR